MYDNYKFYYNFSVDAVRRFFLSKSEKLMLKEKGVYAKKVDKQRRRNGITEVSFIIYCYLENSRLLIRRILQSDWSIRGLYIG